MPKSAWQTVRERTFDNEEKFLSPYAKKSKDTLGRLKEEAPCDFRTEFQRDRDRIIYSNSFKRLKNKTQVFFAPMGDHYITRLTHTFDVAQIARSIARSLALNEDLAEAIALGHDLGHTPFGHVGEHVLDRLSSTGFLHNEQSLRVVDVIEKEGRGLNLTQEVRDGILQHKSSGKGLIAGHTAWLGHVVRREEVIIQPVKEEASSLTKAKHHVSGFDLLRQRHTGLHAALLIGGTDAGGKLYLVLIHRQDLTSTKAAQRIAVGGRQRHQK